MERAGWTRQFQWFKALPNKCRLLLPSWTVFSPVLTFPGVFSTKYCCIDGFAMDFRVNCWKGGLKTLLAGSITRLCTPPRGAGMLVMFMHRALLMLHQLEKPHNGSAREATKHPAGLGSASGERWIHYPTEITSLRSIKMFVFKKKNVLGFFFPHFCCHPSV